MDKRFKEASLEAAIAAMERGADRIEALSASLARIGKVVDTNAGETVPPEDYPAVIAVWASGLRNVEHINDKLQEMCKLLETRVNEVVSQRNELADLLRERRHDDHTHTWYARTDAALAKLT